MDSPTELQQPRGWFACCMECGGNAWVKNAAIHRDTDCEACALLGEERLVFVLDCLVLTEMGWCACGSTKEVDRMMLAYLTARVGWGFPKPGAEGVTEDAEMLLAYMADSLGWTEHGSNVGGAWLTEDGTEALTNLVAHGSGPVRPSL